MKERERVRERGVEREKKTESEKERERKWGREGEREKERERFLIFVVWPIDNKNIGNDRSLHKKMTSILNINQENIVFT